MYYSKSFALLGTLSLIVGVSSCLSLSEQGLNENEIAESQVSKISLSAGLSSPWNQSRAEEESVPTPIMYYIFDSYGVCKDAKLVESASSKAEFSMERGNYKVFALCGALATRPDKSSATQTSAITLPTSSDLCLGCDEIEITDYGQSTETTIGVSHLYSSISLSITDVPSSVTAIKATFGGLYKSVSLDKQFSGTQDVVVDLAKSSEVTTTWYFSDKLMYPCSQETMSISIEVTSSDGTKQTISTTTEYVLASGKKFALTSTFRTLSTIQAGVTLTNGWTTVSGEIDFWNGTGETGGPGEPNEPSSNPSEDPEQPDSSSSSTTYTEGERFGETDAFILKVNKDQNGKAESLLLFGLQIMLGSTKYQIQTSISNAYSESSIAWRVPTIEELSLMMSNYTVDQIKSKAIEYGINNSPITDQTIFGCLSGTSFVGRSFSSEQPMGNNISGAFPVATYPITE